MSTFGPVDFDENEVGADILADPAEVPGAGRTHLTQEPANNMQAADDGLRRQTSFIPQIVAERFDYLLV